MSEEATTAMADAMTDAQKRHDQLTTAPKSTEDDAAPRIEVSDHDGHPRIDIAESAAVRPGAVGDDDDPAEHDEDTSSGGAPDEPDPSPVSGA